MTLKNFPITFIAVILGIYVLKITAHITIPLVIAIFLWYIISAMAVGYNKIITDKFHLNTIVAALSFALIFWFPIHFININIPKIIAETDLYQEKLHELIVETLQYFNIEKTIFFEKAISIINFREIIPSILNSITNIAGNLVIIIIYIIFLFIEEKSFKNKIEQMFKDKIPSKKIHAIIFKISQKIQSYLLIKTTTSLITAFLSFIVMKMFGLEYSVFWSALIFLLNYIPNIGSIIATFFPIVASLLQLADITQTIYLGIGLAGIQFMIGNFLEPKTMGNSLNLSPFAIIFSLIIWGNIWGFTGMYMSVPITVIIMIITSEIPSVKWIAVLLSRDGNINTTEITKI